MTKRDCWNRCDDCGRFISYDDLLSCKAVHRILEPDSDLGVEKYETLCPAHAERKRKEHYS